MISPVSGKPMLVLELHEVEVDYCPETGGLWLDDGELELLLDDPEAAEHILESGRRAAGVKEAPRQCPISRKPMEKWLFGPDPGILIDRSADGHGFWFDRGELRQMLRLADDNPRTKAVIDFLNEMFPMNDEEETAPTGAEKGGTG
jgi:Zn-finger nucleic acid-binding protein